MKTTKYILTLCMLLLAMNTFAKSGSVKKEVYMFGFSASFNDSLIYFTPIQKVNAYIKNDKTHFLQSRDQYSYQLKNYFENRGQLHRTCVTMYSLKKDKAEKMYRKMKEKYTVKSKNKFDVVYLNDNDFKFTTVEEDTTPEFVDSEKAEKAAKKGKGGPKGGPQGPGGQGGQPPMGGGMR